MAKEKSYFHALTSSRERKSLPEEKDTLGQRRSLDLQGFLVALTPILFSAYSLAKHRRDLYKSAGGVENSYFASGAGGRRFDSCRGVVPCSSVVEHLIDLLSLIPRPKPSS